MPVITLSRQVGSGGDDIATSVAQRLNLRLLGRDLINQAAREAGVPQVALAEFDELGLLGIKPGPADMQLYRTTMGRLMSAWANEGDVLFLGRGSQVVLADWPGVLRVRVFAPRSQRIALAGSRWGVSPEVAAALVERKDQARAGYVRRHYGVKADDPALYDLLLNMAHLTVPAAVAAICSAAQIVGLTQNEVTR